MTGLSVVFVTGDRHWKDYGALQGALSAHAPGTWLVEGAASGADSLARQVAMSLGFQPVEMCALWNFHGKKAGPIRNLEMLRNAGHAVTCYACHDDLEHSKGTKHMTGLLTASGFDWTHVKSGITA